MAAETKEKSASFDDFRRVSASAESVDTFHGEDNLESFLFRIPRLATMQKLGPGLLLRIAFLAFILHACPVIAGDKPSSPEEGKLLFSNGDVLHGNFLGCDKAGLHWQSAASKKPLVFQISSLAEAKPAPRAPAGGAMPGTHSVRLANGDELSGTLVSLDENTLLLGTWYAGQLAIPRSAIISIKKLNKSGVVYQGPNNASEWIVDENGERDDNGNLGCVVKNKALVAIGYGEVRCKTKLPPRVDLGFDLTLPAGEPDLDIYFDANETGDVRDCYLFQVGLGGVDIHRISNGNSQHLDGPADIDTTPFRQEKVRLNIRADKQAKKLWLFVNGKKIWEYTDPANFAGTGDCLRFTSQIEQGVMKIRNVKISSWEGEDSASSPVSGKPLKEDLLLLENQDRASGKLKGFANGKAVLATNDGEMNIALDRIDAIQFAAGGNSGKSADGVRAYFFGGGNATLNFESWDGKKVVATSPVFGKAEFLPGAFQQLQFQKRAETPRDNEPVSTPPTASDTAVDVLRFFNGDILHGTFLACDAAGVRWQSPAAKEPLIFTMAPIADIKQGIPKKTRNAAAEQTYFVQTADGDEIPGTLISLDGKSLVLDTWYAGRLTIPRTAVKGIATSKDHKTFFYQGPENMDGWTVSLCNGEDEEGKPVKRKPDWQYKDGAFISTGMDLLEREIKLPVRSSIEFDLDMPGAAFSEGTPEIELQIGDYKGCYRLDLFNEQDHLGEGHDVNKSRFMLRRAPGEGNGIMGPVGEVVGSGGRREKIHVDLRIDRQAAAFWLFINGKLAQQWVDKDGFSGTGNLLSFATMDDEKSFTKVSSIKLSEWNGKLDARPIANAKTAHQDRVVMENGDDFSGAIKSIADGKIHLATAYSEITAPLEHMTEMSMAAALKKTPSGEYLRATLAGGASMLLKVESWDEGRAVVSSPAFGRAVFSPDAFQRLQFNPGKKPLPEEETAGEDGDETP